MKSLWNVRSAQYICKIISQSILSDEDACMKKKKRMKNKCGKPKQLVMKGVRESSKPIECTIVLCTRKQLTQTCHTICSWFASSWYDKPRRFEHKNHSMTHCKTVYVEIKWNASQMLHTHTHALHTIENGDMISIECATAFGIQFSALSWCKNIANAANRASNHWSRRAIAEPCERIATTIIEHSDKIPWPKAPGGINDDYNFYTFGKIDFNTLHVVRRIQAQRFLIQCLSW